MGRKVITIIMAAVFSWTISCINITYSPAPSPATEPPGSSTYVILTNISSPQDPFYPVITELKRIRNGRTVYFEQTVKSTLSELTALRPGYVAVVVKPDMIDVFFAHDVFNLSRDTGKATGAAFTYGFITGTTPSDVMAYLRNLEIWEQGSKTGRAVFRAYYSTSEGAVGGGPGGWGDKQTQNDMKVFTGLDINSNRIDVSQLGEAAIIADLQKAQMAYLHFLLHGTPTKLVQLRLDRLIALEYPKIVFNSGCYGGNVSRWYDESAPDIMADYKKQVLPVDSSQSLAIRFLRSGCIAYFGHMRMTGSNLWETDMIDALAASPRASAGDLLHAWYKKADDYRNIKGLTYPNAIEGVNWSLFDFSTIILYGDPAVRIIP